jgi:hypothetical protein
LRTEAATNNVTDYRVNKAIEHLPALRDKLSAIDDNYLDIQQDILETFVDVRRALDKVAVIGAIVASFATPEGRRTDHERGVRRA